MNIEEKKDRLRKLLLRHPNLLDQMKSKFQVPAESRESVPRNDRLPTDRIVPDTHVFELSMREELFANLLQGRVDPGTVEDIRISPDDQLTRFHYVDKVFEVFFYQYNRDVLEDYFQGSFIESVYHHGFVEGDRGRRRQIYPWAISARLGQYLHSFLLKHNLSSTLEIGLAYGLSALFFCEAHRRRGSGSHIAIDPGQKDQFCNMALNNIRKSGLSSRFDHISAPDHQALPQLDKNGNKFDFIFIDGLHLFDYVLLDFFYADLLLLDGGYIAFDDSTLPGVKPVIDFVRTNRHYRLVPSPTNRLVIFQKVGSDIRLKADPSGFTDFRDSEHVPCEDRLEPQGDMEDHGVLVNKFVSFYHDLVADGRIINKAPWKFDLKLLGKRSSRWRILVGTDHVKLLTPWKQSVKREAPQVEEMQEKISVVGMSARLPKSDHIDEFWQQLLKEEPLFSKVPKERWRWEDYYGDPEDDDRKTLVHSGGYINDAWSFDHDFFGISPKEAELMDPQQRLLLQETYRCIEDSGYSIETLQALRTSVYIAVYNSSFQNRIQQTLGSSEPEILTGDYSFTANRISYHFNFTGSSETMSAACCSSSLSLQAAERALKSRECDVALVGSASIDFSPESLVNLGRMGVLSSENTCIPFQSPASGLMPGEGVAVVMLRRYEDAIECRDHIYGNIVGSGCGHSGNGSGSLTLSHQQAQTQLMRRTLERFGYDPCDIDYFEAHGTGGQGDQIELSAIKKVFGSRREKDLNIGSIKSFVGFNGAASGLTQLIKVLLMIKHQRLVPTIGYQSCNENLKFHELPLNIPASGMPIEEEKPYLAALHSYGLGGSLSFMLVESTAYPTRRLAPEIAGSLQVLPISSRSLSQLKKQVADILEYLEQRPHLTVSALVDMVYTMQTAPEPFDHRALFIVSHVPHLCTILQEFLDSDDSLLSELDLSNNQWSYQSIKEHGETSAEALLSWEFPLKYDDAVDIGRRWLRGESIDWSTIYQGFSAEQLPWKSSVSRYPFEKSTHCHPALRTISVERTEGEPRKNEVGDHLGEKDLIRKIFAESLKIEPSTVLDNMNFADYGLNSLAALSFAKKLSLRFDRQVCVTDLFEHCNVNRLTDFLKESVPSKADDSRTIQEKDPIEEIAIIGMSGQFPEARDIEEFYQNIQNHINCIRELPGGGFGGRLLNNTGLDLSFFQISETDEAHMSRQQKLVLLESWNAVENAGYDSKELSGRKVGVFIGAEPHGEANESFSGHSDAIVASRISYFLNLKGPAFVVNTACSSSGTALHLACESIRHGESEMALAGGVYCASSDEKWDQTISQLVSKSGQCRSFDESCDGSVFSESVGMVLLKPLSVALQDGDQIVGVISATGVNQDGSSNGITAPNGGAERDLMVETYKRFQIDPETIDHFEVHGTGTVLGDSIEARAMISAFQSLTDRTSFCSIGSIKPLIGHTAAASSVVALINMLQSFKYGMRPKLHGFKSLNPLINLDDSAFYVKIQDEKWEKNQGPLTAAINSFGHSGTNTHLVVRELSRRERQILSDRGGPVRQSPSRLRKVDGSVIQSGHSAGLSLRDLRQEIEHRIVASLRKYLIRLEGSSLSTQMNFFDLGLDSLSLVDFTKDLEKSFQISLSQTIVFDYPNIESLVKFLSEDSNLKENFPIKALNQVENEVHADSHRSDFEGELDVLVDEFEEVCPLQIRGDGPIMIGLPPLSGDVGVYKKVASLAGDKIRVIALRSPGFLSDKEPLTEMSALARYYVPVIERLYPYGPITLLGASMGGTLAYELLHHLPHAIRIHRILMLESPLVMNADDAALWQTGELENLVANSNFLMIQMLHLDENFKERKSRGEVVWSDLEISSAEVSDVSEEKRSSALARLMIRRGVKQTSRLLEERLDSMARVHGANLKALREYRAKSLGSQIKKPAVTMLRTNQTQAVSDRVFNPDYLRGIQKERGSFGYFLRGWQGLELSVSEEIIPGDSHFDILGSESCAQTLIQLTLTRPSSESSQPKKKIAVIGMAGRFPGADNIHDLWSMLEQGQTAFGPFPDDRGWENETGRIGGFIDDIKGFDARFFNLTPKEAETMDPSERLFLMEAWKAIEDAGIDPESLAGLPWGVFCGGGGDYGRRLQEVFGFSASVTDSSIPARVAYSLDLNGPCLAVDGGCASSALALTQACDHLRWKRCRVACLGFRV